jgi:hypothetical protein
MNKNQHIMDKVLSSYDLDYYNEDRLEKILEEIYKSCDFFVPFKDKILIWSKLTETLYNYLCN